MRTKVFKSGNSQAVRIPAEMAYNPGTELEVTRVGDTMTLRPAQARAQMEEAFRILDSMPKPKTIELVERTQSRDTLDDLS